MYCAVSYWTFLLNVMENEKKEADAASTSSDGGSMRRRGRLRKALASKVKPEVVWIVEDLEHGAASTMMYSLWE